ncbi:MAG: beta-ketoacyl synthase N-terminal-like domain-containing protein [candidate division FCPU426 bacterium]
MTPELVVTGLGMLHQAGQTPEDFWAWACRAPQLTIEAPGVVPLAPFTPEELIPEDHVRRMDRMSQMLTVMILKLMAGLGPGAVPDPDRVGLCSSTNLGTLDSILKFSRRVFAHGPQRANPMEFPSTVLNASAGFACLETGLRGHNNTTCGSGSLAEAFDALCLGRADAMLATGLEEAAGPQRQTVAQWADGVPRPLSLGRNGCRLGEGAAGLFLEPGERARGRKARVIARYRAHASTYDARGFDTLDPQGRELQRAVQLALERAGLEPGHVRGIVVSASGLVDEDRRLALALDAVFGKGLAAVPLYAFSGLTGYVSGAAEAMGAVCACLALQTRRWPASPWHVPDPDLPAVRIPAEAGGFDGEVVLSVTTDHFGDNHAHVFTRS